MAESPRRRYFGTDGIRGKVGETPIQLHRTGGRSGRSGTSPYRGRLALSEVELRPTTDGWLLAKWNFAPLPKADG